MTMPAFDGRPHQGRGNTSREDFGLRDVLLELVEITYSEEGVTDALPWYADTLATSLSLDFVEVLEHQPESRSFKLLASSGSMGGIHPCLDVPQDLASQAWYTLLRRKPVVVTDSSQEDRFDQWQGLDEAGVRSGVTVPIVLGYKILGILGAHSRRPHNYANDGIPFLEEASRYLAAALSRSKEEKSRREAEQRLRMVEEATRWAAAPPNEDITLQSFSQLFCSASGDLADVCFIDLEIDAGDRIQRAAAARDDAPIPAPNLHRRPLSYSSHLEGSHGTHALLDSDKPEIVGEVGREDLQALAQDDAYLRTLQEVSPTSYMWVPIKVRRHILGALVLVSGTRVYRQKDAEYAERLASVVGLALYNSRARLQALGQARGEIEHYLPKPDSFVPHPPDSGAQHALETSAGEARNGHPEPMFMPGRRKMVLNYLCQDIDVLEIARPIATTKFNTVSRYQSLLGKGVAA